MIRSGKAAMVVKTYYTVTSEVSAKLAGMFKAAFPDCYHKYEKAFSAGVWVEQDKGPWIGRVIV